MSKRWGYVFLSAEARNTGREADGAKNQKEPSNSYSSLWVQGPQALVVSRGLW